MKKLALIVVLVLIGSAAFAQLDPFMPPNPITFGQGGAFTANAEGMNAFFYNPAGFRHDEGELTLTSVGVYTMIDRSLLDLVMDLAGIDSGGSRQSEELPLPPGLDVLVGDLTVVADWLGGLDQAELDDAIAAAQTSLEDIDPALAYILNDPSGVTEEELALIVLEADIFSDTDNDGTTNLVEILIAMDTAVGGGGTLEAALVAEGSSLSEMNDNVKEAEDSIPGGEMRLGALAGIAYTGHGLGIGLFVSADGTFNGDNILNTKGRMLTSITLAGGYAFPLGPITIGAQLRPTILGYTDIYPAELLLSGGSDMASIFGEAFYTGFYLGLDAGALFDLGPFTFGLAVKDMLPIPVKWTSYDGYEEYLAGLSAGSFFGPNEVSQDGLYQIPVMKVNVGAQFHPDLGPLSWIIDPRVNLDIHDLFGFLRYINQDENPLTADKATLGTGYNFIKRLHVGAEAAFLGGLVSARGGFYGDYLNAGIGFHLLFLDINAAVGASNLEKNAEGNFAFRQIGVSLEAALRF
jgi:hypothetical protein